MPYQKPRRKRLGRLLALGCVAIAAQAFTASTAILLRDAGLSWQWSLIPAAIWAAAVLLVLIEVTDPRT
jgi:hypothetical protein